MLISSNYYARPTGKANKIASVKNFINTAKKYNCKFLFPVKYGSNTGSNRISVMSQRANYAKQLRKKKDPTEDAVKLISNCINQQTTFNKES